MTRVAMLALFAFLAGALALNGLACESRHVDQNFDTEAGADFDAPAAGASDGGADAGGDGVDASDDGG
jgi:hypothetical protein